MFCAEIEYLSVDFPLLVNIFGNLFEDFFFLSNHFSLIWKFRNKVQGEVNATGIYTLRLLVMNFFFIYLKNFGNLCHREQGSLMTFCLIVWKICVSVITTVFMRVLFALKNFKLIFSFASPVSPVSLRRSCCQSLCCYCKEPLLRHVCYHAHQT